MRVRIILFYFNFIKIFFKFKPFLTQVSRTEAFPELSKKPPENKLIAIRPILSLLGHMALILAIQIFTFFYVKWMPWLV